MPLKRIRVPAVESGDHWFCPREGHMALLRLRVEEEYWTLTLYRTDGNGDVDLRAVAGSGGSIFDGNWYPLAVMAGIMEII